MASPRLSPSSLAISALLIAVAAACGGSSFGHDDAGPDATGDSPADAGQPETSTQEGGFPDVGAQDHASPDTSSSSDASDASDASDGNPPADTGGPRDVAPPDAPGPPDAPMSEVTAACVPGPSFGGGGPGSCSLGTGYTCGADMYQIECDCPAATCTCTKNSKTVKAVPYSGCPNCTVYPSFSSIASMCGIPF